MENTLNQQVVFVEALCLTFVCCGLIFILFYKLFVFIYNKYIQSLIWLIYANLIYFFTMIYRNQI